jgi:hypothetical protein
MPRKCKGPASSLVDRVRGRVTDSPMIWPWTYEGHGHGTGGTRILILTGALVRAIRAESNQAVAHYWGVSRWRRALGGSAGRAN